jgi:transcriptional regulator with XRE-family HTH domain
MRQKKSKKISGHISASKNETQQGLPKGNAAALRILIAQRTDTTHFVEIARKSASNVSTQGSLKEARAEANLTQAALGKRVGVPQSTSAALETGEHKTARNVAEIAAVFNVEALWLSSGRGPKRANGTPSFIDHRIFPHVRALAEKLSLVPDEKLKAVSILLGIKL